MALFSDSKTSKGNQVSAGTLDLSFDGSGSFDFDASLAPTQDTTSSVTLVNDGSTDSVSLAVDVAYEGRDAESNDEDQSADAVAENLEVTQLQYDDTDIRHQIDPSEDPPTLYDLTHNAESNESRDHDLVSLGDPDTGTDFTVTLRLKDVGDEFQSDGVAVTFTFHLTQTNEG